MKKKPKRAWDRPGVRVNVYFEDVALLKQLDALAKKNGLNRAAQIRTLVAQQVSQ